MPMIAFRSMAVASTSRSILPVLTKRSLHASARLQRAPGRSSGDNNDDNDGGFISRPGPPPLPPNEQREFERLVREKANAPQFMPASFKESTHPEYRAKPRAEFDGEENPNTGEVGGPKNDPLKWQGEWTYGGRSTDF